MTYAARSFGMEQEVVMLGSLGVSVKTIPLLRIFQTLLLSTAIASCTSSTIEQKKLLAGDRGSDDYFGYSVALSGKTALVGAYKNDNEGGIDAGAAYVFVASDSDWRQQAKLMADDGAPDDTFGGNVALDGNNAVVGSRNDDDIGEDSGSAYVFARDGNTWQQMAKLVAEDGAVGDAFGQAVAISNDYIVVGSPHDDDFGNSSGSAYVFRRNGSSWYQEAKLIASDGAAGDVFGISVSVSGERILVGADLHDEIAEDAGAAYMFVRTEGGWVEQAKLTAADGAKTDLFGVRVALSGETALISARRDDDPTMGVDAGSAYVFVQRDGMWIEQAKLIAPDGSADDRFARSVALFGDTALIGAMFTDDSGENSGSAYLFSRTGDSWTPVTKLLASDGGTDDLFGWSIAIGQDYMLVGAIQHDAGLNEAGASFIYSFPDN
ncbi:MAG: FG-GAP repeat protein [Pseudomonadota bacterium]